MTKSVVSSAFAAGAFGLLVLGCGPSAPPASSMDGGRTGTDASLPGVDAGSRPPPPPPSDAGSTTMVDAPPAPTGACVADEATLADQEQVESALRACGTRCFLRLNARGRMDRTMVDACVGECMNDMLEAPISSGCSACFGGMIHCNYQHCAPSPCGGGVSDACDACQCEFSCVQDFEACSGGTTRIMCME